MEDVVDAIRELQGRLEDHGLDGGFEIRLLSKADGLALHGGMLRHFQSNLVPPDKGRLATEPREMTLHGVRITW